MTIPKKKPHQSCNVSMFSCITSQNVLTLRYMYEDNLLLPKCESHFSTDRRKLCPYNINNSYGSFVTSKFMIIFINLIVRLPQMFILFFCQTCLPFKVRDAEINRIHFYCTTEYILTHLIHSHVTFAFVSTSTQASKFRL